MDQKNFEYLKGQLKYTGFTEQLSEQLLSSMQKRLPAFSLQYKARFGGDELTASLNFQRSTGNQMYFFNSYLASLKNRDQPQKVNQLFYIRPSGSITLKEAFNLLQGRAVEKQFINRQGEPYRAWVQLDFKNTDLEGNFKIRQFHQNYGYDLAAQVSKLSLKELDDDLSKSRLLESLRQGNRQQVTLLDQGQEHKLYIEASPQFKAIIAYDRNSVRSRSSPLLAANKAGNKLLGRACIQGRLKGRTQGSNRAFLLFNLPVLLITATFQAHGFWQLSALYRKGSPDGHGQLPVQDGHRASPNQRGQLLVSQPVP